MNFQTDSKTFDYWQAVIKPTSMKVHLNATALSRFAAREVRVETTGATRHRRRSRRPKGAR